MLTRPRTLPTGFIQPCLPINAPRPPAGASTTASASSLRGDRGPCGGGAFLGWALVDDTAHDLPYARGMTQRKRLQIGAAVALATIIPLLSFAPVTAPYDGKEITEPIPASSKFVP
jgi:hypothetical protein